MVVRHLLRIDPDHLEDVLEGRKRAEYRHDDRKPAFAAGHSLHLMGFDRRTRKLTGKGAIADVVHVNRGGHIPEGYAMLSMDNVRPATGDPEEAAAEAEKAAEFDLDAAPETPGAAELRAADAESLTAYAERLASEEESLVAKFLKSTGLPPSRVTVVNENLPTGGWRIRVAEVDPLPVQELPRPIPTFRAKAADVEVLEKALEAVKGIRLQLLRWPDHREPKGRYAFVGSHDLHLSDRQPGRNCLTGNKDL